MLNVLFDLDGTLLDPGRGITRCLQHALRCLRRPTPHTTELLQYIGPPLRKTFGTLLETESREIIERAVTLYRERYTVQGLFEAELYPGVRQVLAELQDGHFRLLLVTAKPKIYAERLVEHLGLSRFFEKVFGPDLDGRLDDKTELVRHVVTVRRLSPERTLMVGDRREDMVAAKENRIGTIGVLYGYGSLAELSETAPDRLCDAPGDLCCLIRSYFETQDELRASGDYDPIS